MQGELPLSGGTTRGVLTWQCYPNICRADYAMIIDGKPTGLWIKAVQHPTALRPYYIVMPNGLIVARKYSHLAAAKTAACLRFNQKGDQQ